MKYAFAFIALTTFASAVSGVQAQPAYQYNDRYHDQRYERSAMPTQQPSQDTAVSSPVGNDRPLTEEEMRNAKPMGMYIDAPRPLPRGGNQPAPEVPQSTPSGAPQWQPGVAPGAVEGYRGSGQ